MTNIKFSTRQRHNIKQWSHVPTTTLKATSLYPKLSEPTPILSLSALCCCCLENLMMQECTEQYQAASLPDLLATPLQSDARQFMKDVIYAT